MRLACLFMLLAASQAVAKTPFMIWTGRAINQASNNPTQIFRFGTSDTAFIEHLSFGGGPNPSFHTLADGPNTAALIADMTNGVNDPITWTTASFSYVMDEDRFFTQTPSASPLIGYSHYAPNLTTDLAGWTISEIRMSGSAKNFQVEVWGYAPEPSSAALLILGCCFAHVTIGSCRSRRSSRSR